MKVIRARNINSAWDQAKITLNNEHVVRPSRVGEVWEFPEPVTTVYERPWERVLFNAERNANPIFHLMEALWMLAGRNDVAWLERFNSKITEFVGKGPLLHDAYGHRWRYAFDMDGGAEDGWADQLPKIVRMLKNNHDERRAVLTMWNPLWDLERPDQPSVPCNTQIYFKIREGKLTMLVTCRSNDICMGAYGANVVHMSLLQEYMAAMIGVPMGRYYQVSDSWHAYTSRYEQMGGFSTIPSENLYNGLYNAGNAGIFKNYPLISDPESFDDDLNTWMRREWKENEFHGIKNRFFIDVAEPLWQAWNAYKDEDDLLKAANIAGTCKAKDWSIAAEVWFNQLAQKRVNKEASRLLR